MATSSSPTPATRGALGDRPAERARARILWALIAAAAALRFGTLGVQSFWLDESATVLLLRQSLPELLTDLPASESAPPLYYLLAWAWTSVLGTGELGVRSLSALIGTATVPVAYLAARPASERAGLWAAGLAACNPLLFYYAQEARVYALLILLSGAAFVAWQRAYGGGRGRPLVAWAALSALALLTHYFAVFLFVPQAVALVLRTGLRRSAAACGAVCAVGLALVPLALRQRADGKSDWIEATPLPSRLAQAPKQFLVGIEGPAELVSAFLGAGLAGAALALLFLRASRAERAVAMPALAISGVALALPLLLSLSGVLDVFNGRNVVAAWVPALVPVAVGVGTVRGRRAGALVGGSLCALALAVVIGTLLDPRAQRDDWRGVAEALGPAPPSGSASYAVAPANGGVPLAVYGAGRSATAPVIRARELTFIVLPVRRSGRAALAPQPVRRGPPGFVAAGTTVTESFALARFVSPEPRAVAVAELGRILAISGTDAVDRTRATR